MGGLLSSLPIGQLSAGALVALIVLMVLRGGLVPRRQLLDMREDRDAWHKAADDWQKAAITLGMSVDKLTVLAETANHALTEIRTIAQRVEDP